MSSSPSYLDPVILPLIRGETVLDVACGYGRWCHLLKANYWEAGLSTPPDVDGLDAFAPNVEAAQAGGCYRRVWQQELPGPLEGQWDTVIAVELVEHLPQDRVEEVVAALERAARLRVIFTTPNQPALRGGVEGVHGLNAYDAHLSYVPRSFFGKRGYELRGAGFGGRHPLARLGTRLRLASTLESLPRHLPALAQTIVAFRDVEG